MLGESGVCSKRPVWQWSGGPGDGYSAPFDGVRRVRVLEAAGAAAVQLEDHVTPEGCGYMPGEDGRGGPDHHGYSS